MVRIFDFKTKKAEGDAIQDLSIIPWLQKMNWLIYQPTLQEDKEGVDLWIKRVDTIFGLQVKADNKIATTQNFYFQVSKWQPQKAKSTLTMYVDTHNMIAYVFKTEDILKHWDWILENSIEKSVGTNVGTTHYEKPGRTINKDLLATKIRVVPIKIGKKEKYG